MTTPSLAEGDGSARYRAFYYRSGYLTALHEQAGLHCYGEKMARLKEYHPAVAARIAELVANRKTVSEIGKLPEFPTAMTIRKWIAANPEFATLIWDARREAAQQMADEICNIADDVTIDPNSRRVMIEARKFLVTKLLPQYNDKLTLAGDMSNPLVAVLAAVDGRTAGPPSKRSQVIESDDV